MQNSYIMGWTNFGSHFRRYWWKKTIQLSINCDCNEKFRFRSKNSSWRSFKRLNLTRNGKLTNAAILLFGLNPQKYVLQAKTQCAKFKGVTTNEFEDMHDFEGTIIDQRDDAVRLQKNISKEVLK